jgi:subtilase family serine protease
MTLRYRPVRAGVAAGLGLATTVAVCSLGTAAMASRTAAPSTVALANSVPATTDHMTGAYSSRNMTIQVVLSPRNPAGLASALKAAYTKGSGGYHRWLAKGQFNARYAPTAAHRSSVASFLRNAGLKVVSSPSPFLVRATGPSAKVSAAFGTSLRSYTNKAGRSYFQNSTAIRVPASMAGYVQGVTGLTNTIRSHSMAQRAKNVARPAAKHGKKAAADCEAPYPTAAQQFASVDNGAPIPFGFGDAPGCQGLTPSQDNSIYGAPNGGPRVKGKGVNLAVFELSAYQHSDINTFAQTFFGKHFTPPLVDVNVDGGPLAPQCPAGDTCPADFNGFAGDIEVDADIETQLAIAPDVRNLIVYNAPNDFTGQTELDEWTAIANADQADAVSSSWAVCENDAGAAYAQAENTIFEQMALQGQSTFGAEGDTGAFSCIRSDGTTIVNVLDPPSQPWVTSVGGTSLETANPGHNPHPRYPQGVESVWNTDALCSNAPPGAANDNLGGFFWCARTGAGGGASSQFWGRPFYQRGPGVNNQFTTTGNGTTQCSLAAQGTPCREDPDISANADEFTPYAEFCTGNANTPNSVCGTFSQDQTPPGWFGIGGTSLSSPLWSAIIADRDSFQGFRSGNINPVLYLLFNIAPGRYFHDITGHGQTTTNNGLFPVTRGYDEATGIGTPQMAALITRSF